MKKKKEKKIIDDKVILLYKDESYDIIHKNDLAYRKDVKYVMIPHTTFDIGGMILVRPTKFWDFDSVEITMDLTARNYDFDDDLQRGYEYRNSDERVLLQSTHTYTDIVGAINALHSIYKLQYISNLFNACNDNGCFYTTIGITYVKIVVKKDQKTTLVIEEESSLLQSLKHNAIDSVRIMKAVKPFYQPASLGEDFVFHMENGQWDYDLMLKTTHRYEKMHGLYLWFLKGTHLLYPIFDIEWLNMRKDVHGITINLLIDNEVKRMPEEANRFAFHRMEETDSFWGEYMVDLSDASDLFEFSRYSEYFTMTIMTLMDEFVFYSDPLIADNGVYMIGQVILNRKMDHYFYFDHRNINSDEFWWEFVYEYNDRPL